MQVKAFEGVSLRDAVRNVKKEFGDDAVILSTREVMPKDRAGGTKLYEVTAARAESRVVGGKALGSEGVDLRRLEVQMATLLEHVTALGTMGGLERRLSQIEVGVREAKLLLLQDRDVALPEDLSKELGSLMQQLRLAGVEAASRAALARALKDLEVSPGVSAEEFYRNQGLAWLAKRIRIAPRWELREAARGWTAVLVGLPGSGKSTLAAKIGAHLQSVHNKRVGLVSFENRSVAAAEVLRVYAKILGIRHQTVSDVSGLEAALRMRQEVDCLIVDTGAGEVRAPAALEGLRAISASDPGAEFHLVLNLAEKEVQMDQSVRTFGELNLQSLMFTRLDESLTAGELYNVGQRWSLPLSYFSIGSAVPEDLERASRERVLERVFGLQ